VVIHWMDVNIHFFVVIQCLVYGGDRIGITRFSEYSSQTVVELIPPKVVDEANHFWLPLFHS
jgi:hypothetical protein